MKLLLRQDGTCAGVYDDLVRDLLPGTLAVSRVSEVEFFPERQVWRATDVNDGTLLAEHPLRQECLEEEKRVVERRLYAN